MLYREFQDLNLSRLGMGAMRLPKIEGKGEAIDEPKAAEIIVRALENGINYFDTAYRYHGGESERVTGKVLSQFRRDSFYLATKMPGHMMSYDRKKFSFTGLLSQFPSLTPAEIFEEQLEKCRVDYFDFYLLHNLSETSVDFYTNEEVGVIPYLLEQKKKGRIRHLGFSAHGRAETIDSFLKWSESRFPAGCFEIVQLQLNYLDWILQDAKAKYEVVTRHGLPVIAMEPVRGGKLAALSAGASEMLNKARPGETPVSWAFRFLQSLPNLAVVLSGMSAVEQLEENAALFSAENPTTKEENELLVRVVDTMVNLVPCTGCAYCVEACPQKLDIPKLVSMNNEARTENPFTLKFTLDAMKPDELPSACVACGECARVCPQSIDIPAVMKEFALAVKKLSA